MVWSEVFARCDDPSVPVRWSNFSARTAVESVAPRSVSVNYQSYADGGCTNTDVGVDDVGIVQVTNAERTTAQGARLVR